MVAAGRNYLYVDCWPGDHPRRRDRADRAGLQHARRRPARHLRPAPEAVVNVQTQTEASQVRDRLVRTSLDVSGLTTRISLRRGAANAVDNVSFTLDRGEILGLVGESGCGKTMTALTLMRLLPPAATVVGGRALLDGRDVLALSRREMRPVRGNERRDGLPGADDEPRPRLHDRLTRSSRRSRPTRRRARAQPASARSRCSSGSASRTRARRVDDYPHQFSGGMRQRVMIAIALVLRAEAADRRRAHDRARRDDPGADPRADRLELREELGMSVILITHNLGVVNEIAHRVAVMYAGEIVESGPTGEILGNPKHPYTQGLLRSMPGIGRAAHEAHVIPGRVPELADAADRLPLRPPLPQPHCRAASRSTRRSPSSPPTMSSAASTPLPSPSEPFVLRSRALTKHFAVDRDVVGKPTSLPHGRRRRRPRHPARRDARPGRRVRLGQEHACAADPAAPAGNRAAPSCSRAATCSPRRGRSCATSAGARRSSSRTRSARSTHG